MLTQKIDLVVLL